jgi:hypothetical protein
MYDTDIMPFERSLAPGESFTTACASLIPYRNSDAFNDPQETSDFGTRAAR